MITYDSPAIPTPETSYRKNACKPSKSAQSPATKLVKDAHRRRRELRRIKSFSRAISVKEKQANEIKSTDSGGGQMSFRHRSYGKISVVGRQREMNDVAEVELGFAKRGNESYDFIGIFDGREGRRAALACSQLLHQMLAVIVEEEEEEESGEEKLNWEEVMIEGFDEVEAEINKNGEAGGCDTVVAVVGGNEVVVAAKCGGSKAVVCHGGEAVRLLEEYESEKEVQVRVSIRRRREDEFLILGSRGFWDVISDEVACQVARRYCDDGLEAEAVAALMAELAVAHGSKDNISVILVDLRCNLVDAA